ncbi:MAG: oligosaccharide flippase family protein [Bacteroidia bacterium]
MSIRRLFYQSAIYGLSSIVGRLLNWLLTPLFVHKIPPEEFGRLSELYAWMVFGLIFLTGGLETAFFRQARIEKLNHLRYALWIWSGGGFFLLAVAAYFSRDLLGYADRPLLIGLTLGILLMDSWGALPMAAFRLMQKPHTYVALSLGNILLSLALLIYGVGFRGYGVEYILSVNLIASVTRWLIAEMLCGWRKEKFSWKEVLSLWRYGAWIMLAGLIGAVTESLDRIWLARYDWVENAYYAAHYKLAMALALFTQAYRYAAEAYLFKEAVGDKIFYARSWSLYQGISWLGMLTLGLWAPEFIRWIFPPSYWPAVKVLPWLLAAYVFAGAYQHVSIWYKKQNPSWGLYFSLAGAAITISLNAWGIPRYGMYAAAWATFLAYGAMLFLCGFFEARYEKVPYPWRAWLFTGIAIGIVLFLGYGYGLSVSIKVGLFTLGILSLYPLLRAERKLAQFSSSSSSSSLSGKTGGSNSEEVDSHSSSSSSMGEGTF